VFLVEYYVNAESFKTTQSDYSHRFGCPAPAKFVIWESVKQLRQTGNVNIPKRARRSTVATETRCSRE
jgi:hypothetical protein